MLFRSDVMQNAVDHIIDASYDPIYGARSIKRYIQSNIETLIARKMIECDIAPDTTIVIDYKDGEFTADFVS